MKRMILLMPLMALTVIGCSRNNDQARTSHSDLATAQSGNTGSSAGTTSGTDTSGTASGTAGSETSSGTGAGTDTSGTPASPGPNGTTDQGTNNGSTTR